MNNFSDILNSNRLGECIVSLKRDKEKLEEIIKRPASSRKQEKGIEIVRELLDTVNNILSTLDRSN